MIYAIKAGEHIKFGFSSDFSRRLSHIDTHCPHELEVLALADWPHTQESAIHLYLRDHRVKLEWFTDCDATRLVVAWMLDKSTGLTHFQYAFSKQVESGGWRYVAKRPKPELAVVNGKPRVDAEPTLNPGDLQRIRLARK